MRDVIGPGGAAVRLAGEGVLLAGSLRCPGSAEAGGGVRTEVTSLGADGLDDHEVLLLALKGVDLDSLEEVVLSVRHDDGRGSTEVAGEVTLRHRSTVDLAVVTGEKQVHVVGITNNSLVNGTSVRSSDLSREEGLGRSPSVRVRRVGRGAVGEGGRTPLVRKNPELLGSKVEDSWGYSVEAGTGLGCSRQLREVADTAKDHGTIALAVVV